MTIGFAFALIAFVLTVVDMVRNRVAPWGLLVPIAVALLALIHILSGTYLR